MPKYAARKNSPRKKNSSTRLWIIAGAAALLLVIVVVLVNANQTLNPPAPVAATGRTWGKTDAPVTIDEYADFQCPLCGQQELVLRQLSAKYIDSGKVKVIFHNFAFIGQESTWAALAANCAEDQGKFWAFASYVFEHQSGENQGAFAQDKLKGFAKDVGLDPTAFNSCFDDSKYQSKLDQENSEARSLGILSTPTMYINGQKFVGLQAAGQLSSILDSRLK